MNRLRTELSEVRSLTLTKRGELVRDTAAGLLAVPALWAFVVVSVAGLEGMGL